MGSPWGWFGKGGGRRAGRWAAGGTLCALMLSGWLYGGYTLDELHRQGWRAWETASGVVRTVAHGSRDLVLRHPYFAIRDVEVLGAERARRADIVVRSGLAPHTRIWSVDPGAVEEQVRRHPWVKAVRIRRELPARLVITIEEWSPGAIVALDKLYYVADNGVIFKALDEKDPVDFPFITGLRAAGLPPEAPATREKVSEALVVGRAVEQTALGLSEIRFQPGGGIVLYPVSYPVPFHMGWGDWDGKLSRLEWFLREFQGKGARFRAVDLSFRGQVVVRPRGRV